jgi:hypothetical protein
MAERIFLRPVTETSATLADLVQSDYTGSLIREEPDGKKYRLVKNGTASSAAMNGGITLEFSANSSANVQSVIIYTTTTSSCCGIALPLYNGGSSSTNAIPGDHYFWMQVGGVATATGSATAFRPVYGSTTDGAIATSGSPNIIGTALETISSSTGDILLHGLI